MAEEPGYVQEVKREFASVSLAPLSLSVQPLPSRISPILISVIRNEGDRLADFLRHYRAGGIRRFCFIDNGSTDGSLGYLAAQPDVDLYQRPGVFDWKLKQGWINRAIASYGLERWFLYVDADEHVVFEESAQRGFEELAAEMERRGIWRVRGFLLDMYAQGPLLNTGYRAGERLLDSYPFHDRTGYVESRYREVLSVKGGPRRRVFSAADPAFNPEMVKYPLFRLKPGEFMANPHHIWPYDANFLSPRHLAILHFKFLPHVAERIREALERRNYWGGSAEYRNYHEVLSNTPDLTLHGAVSTRYVSPERLVDEGLIARMDWPRGATPGHALLAAARAHRAALGGCLPFQPVPASAAEPEPLPGLPPPIPPPAKPLPPAGRVSVAPPRPLATPASSEATTIRPKEPVARARDGRFIVTVNEYRSKPPHYRHLDLTIPDLPLEDASRAAVRFKLGLSGVAPRLEFRPGPSWPLFARAWPGEEADHFGPVFRVGPGGPRAKVMALIPEASDRAAIAAIIGLLPEIVAAVLPQLPLSSEDVVLFSRAAIELPAALS
ncbi:glycosyltransferase family 2 protein [Sediminicoccus sp. KRV36]|uniref:glycosyltransferase family 2 protein n=1 Tax=Sediminicoccus sp. KRV36 TaxID=3133721 RepID=UPI00200C5008|nr:glycosyltransferase family 2 protein [Sediminicoccus rosea]UPY37479.1 glycosyltransferase family 2 protein [Sediminicoccus rosea]